MSQMPGELLELLVTDLPLVMDFPLNLPDGIEARGDENAFCLWSPKFDLHVLVDCGLQELEQETVEAMLETISQAISERMKQALN